MTDPIQNKPSAAEVMREQIDNAIRSHPFYTHTVADSLHHSAVELGHRGGMVGGRARAAALGPARRSEIAREGGKARSRV
jgi:hypothetical protein